MEMLRDSDSSDDEEDDDNKYDCEFSDDVTDDDEIVMFEDIIFYGGKLYAISIKAVLYVCDISRTQISWRKLRTQSLIMNPEHDDHLVCKYLVESSGELLMVLRIWEHCFAEHPYCKNYVFLPHQRHTLLFYHIIL